ncbi:flagellar hook-basal body complex protein FliE [uncultured Pseudacidovorax sp.]|uniref:flagellar hook-basal body complex protein FliE n=1 Tax=uncultured Pseudacidovorax sp. TaxID=679313 RepID=UPI0025DC0721|nr:flagellar hook-basal body complex protein FliE [uncultured Pseudacidovorax sp.]
MELRLNTVTPSAAGLRPAGSARPAANVEAAPGGGFSSALSGALREVSNAQNESSRLQREVQMENPQVSLEQTMVAMQKSQVGFQATMQVRNRLVQAYTDIMNMQV